MEIVFEDNHFLIINKKPGQLSQSDKTGDQSILELCKNYIKLKYSKKGNVFLGLVNRIDRPTSGLLILAKTSKCLERMNKILRNREIKKTYLAITEKHPIKKSGRLINFLKKNEKKNKSFVVNKETKGSKESILNYKLVKELDNPKEWTLQLCTQRVVAFMIAQSELIFKTISTQGRLTLRARIFATPNEEGRQFRAELTLQTAASDMLVAYLI